MPSAWRPASSTALLTCALGTSGSKSMGVSRARAFDRAAAAVRRTRRMRAPMRSSGTMIRPHRPAPERVVAGDRRAERMRGEDAGEHAHRAAGIAGVEDGSRARAGRAAARPATVTRRPPLRVARDLLDGDAERPQAAQRRSAVGAGRIAVDGGGAVGDRRQQGVAVRNRLVAGRAHAAAHAGGRLHQHRVRRGHGRTIAGGSVSVL